MSDQPKVRARLLLHVRRLRASGEHLAALDVEEAADWGVELIRLRDRVAELEATEKRLRGWIDGIAREEAGDVVVVSLQKLWKALQDLATAHPTQSEDGLDEAMSGLLGAQWTNGLRSIVRYELPDLRTAFTGSANDE